MNNKILMLSFIQASARRTYEPIFSDNSWQQIAAACRNNEIPSTWQVGDTKTVTLNDSNTYTVRVVDMTLDRYTYSDNSGATKMVFEFVECLPNSYQMNLTDTSVGGWKESLLRNKLNNEILNLFPKELKNLIRPVNIYAKPIDTSPIADKLFLPCVYELRGTCNNGDGDQSLGVAEAATQFNWYLVNNAKTDLIKNKVGTDSPVIYWTRSQSHYWNPTNNDKKFCSIYTTGTGTSINSYWASSDLFVAPVFAF